MNKRKKPAPPRTEPAPPCTVQGCSESGEFKAPAARDTVGQYQYLCLEHVRKFNQAWDYFNGWSQDEIEAFMHSSVHGHRPTWSIHQLAGNKPFFTTETLEEALHRMIGEGTYAKPRKPETKAEREKREALAVLNLELDADIKMVKSQYKILVKKYHPDVNSSRHAEDVFKRITEAYVLLSKKPEKHHET
jgi:DnaJ domain